MNILFIVTSADTLAPGHPTGVWLEEYAIPYVALSEAGISVTVASPKGGQGPIDPKTKPDDKAAARWGAALGALSRTKRLADVHAEDFDAVFIPGGHGPMVDLATDPAVADLVSAFVVEQKIVAAVCHGPAALLGVTWVKRPITMSIGVASRISASNEGADPLRLIEHADAALYTAKHSGRNCIRHYTDLASPDCAAKHDAIDVESA